MNKLLLVSFFIFFSARGMQSLQLELFQAIESRVDSDVIESLVVQMGCQKRKRCSLVSRHNRSPVERVGEFSKRLYEGADSPLDCCNKDGYTPLIRAIQQNNPDLAQLFLDYGASDALPDQYSGMKPIDYLLIARKFKDGTMVEFETDFPKLQEIFRKIDKEIDCEK